MPIDALLIADGNGIPIYSKQIGDQKIDEILLLGFFSALKSFAKSAINTDSKDSNDLRAIRIGNRLLDFSSAEFEQIGCVDVLLMSHGMPPTITHTILEEITEEFAIFVDNLYTDKPTNRENAKRGHYPDFSGFNEIFADILSANEIHEVIDYNLNVSVPGSIFSLIIDIFNINPKLAEMYEYNEQLLIEQVLSELALKQLEPELRRTFKDFVKSSKKTVSK